MFENLSKQSLMMMTERIKTAREQSVDWRDLVGHLSIYLPFEGIHQEWTLAASQILAKVYGIKDLKTVKESGLRLILSSEPLNGLHTHNGRDVCNTSYKGINRVIGGPTLEEHI